MHLDIKAMTWPCKMFMVPRVLLTFSESAKGVVKRIFQSASIVKITLDLELAVNDSGRHHAF